MTFEYTPIATINKLQRDFDGITPDKDHVKYGQITSHSKLDEHRKVELSLSIKETTYTINKKNFKTVTGSKHMQINHITHSNPDAENESLNSYQKIPLNADQTSHESSICLKDNNLQKYEINELPEYVIAQCRCCNNKFIKVQPFIDHLNRCNVDLSCKYCQKQFPDDGKFTTHLLRGHWKHYGVLRKITPRKFDKLITKIFGQDLSKFNRSDETSKSLPNAIEYYQSSEEIVDNDNIKTKIYEDNSDTFGEEDIDVFQIPDSPIDSKKDIEILVHSIDEENNESQDQNILNKPLLDQTNCPSTLEIQNLYPNVLRRHPNTHATTNNYKNQIPLATSKNNPLNTKPQRESIHINSMENMVRNQHKPSQIDSNSESGSLTSTHLSLNKNHTIPHVNTDPVPYTSSNLYNGRPNVQISQSKNMSPNTNNPNYLGMHNSEGILYQRLNPQQYPLQINNSRVPQIINDPPSSCNNNRNKPHLKQNSVNKVNSNDNIIKNRNYVLQQNNSAKTISNYIPVKQHCQSHNNNIQNTQYPKPIVPSTVFPQGQERLNVNSVFNSLSSSGNLKKSTSQAQNFPDLQFPIPAVQNSNTHLQPSNMHSQYSRDMYSNHVQQPHTISGIQNMHPQQQLQSVQQGNNFVNPSNGYISNNNSQLPTYTQSLTQNRDLRLQQPLNHSKILPQFQTNSKVNQNKSLISNQLPIQLGSQTVSDIPDKHQQLTLAGSTNIPLKGVDTRKPLVFVMHPDQLKHCQLTEKNDAVYVTLAPPIGNPQVANQNPTSSNLPISENAANCVAEKRSMERIDSTSSAISIPVQQQSFQSYHNPMNSNASNSNIAYKQNSQSDDVQIISNTNHSINRTVCLPNPQNKPSSSNIQSSTQNISMTTHSKIEQRSNILDKSVKEKILNVNKTPNVNISTNLNKLKFYRHQQSQKPCYPNLSISKNIANCVGEKTPVERIGVSSSAASISGHRKSFQSYNNPMNSNTSNSNLAYKQNVQSDDVQIISNTNHSINRTMCLPNPQNKPASYNISSSVQNSSMVMHSNIDQHTNILDKSMNEKILNVNKTVDNSPNLNNSTNFRPMLNISNEENAKLVKTSSAPLLKTLLSSSSNKLNVDESKKSSSVDLSSNTQLPKKCSPDQTTNRLKINRTNHSFEDPSNVYIIDEEEMDQNGPQYEQLDIIELSDSSDNDDNQSNCILECQINRQNVDKSKDAPITAYSSSTTLFPSKKAIEHLIETSILDNNEQIYPQIATPDEPKTSNENVQNTIENSVLANNCNGNTNNMQVKVNTYINKTTIKSSLAKKGKRGRKRKVIPDNEVNSEKIITNVNKKLGRQPKNKTLETGMENIEISPRKSSRLKTKSLGFYEDDISD